MPGGGSRAGLAACLVAAIAACAVWIVWKLRTGGRPAPARFEWQCVQCGHVFRARAEVQAKGPQEVLETATAVARHHCPKCGGQAGQRVARACPKCKTAFLYVPGLTPEPDGGFALGAERGEPQCVNAQCGNPQALLAGGRPEGEWRRCRCAKCGRTFDVLLPSGPAPPLRCYGPDCGGEARPESAAEAPK